jgi:hypothetical protein
MQIIPVGNGRFCASREEYAKHHPIPGAPRHEVPVAMGRSGAVPCRIGMPLQGSTGWTRCTPGRTCLSGGVRPGAKMGDAFGGAGRHLRMPAWKRNRSIGRGWCLRHRRQTSLSHRPPVARRGQLSLSQRDNPMSSQGHPSPEGASCLCPNGTTQCQPRATRSPKGKGAPGMECV